MSQRFCIGFDLGGTHLRAARVDRAGGISGLLKCPSRADESPDAPLDVMAVCVRRLMEEGGEPIAVGLGSPGMIDPATGTQIGRTPHMPHWVDMPVRDRLAHRLALPVFVDNDANMAALAEHHCGAARQSRVSMTVTVGTGVGCGIVVDGHVFRGPSGGAGEIGHLPLGDGSLECRCGIESCVEPEMSGSGLSRRASELGLMARDAAAVLAAAARGAEPEARLVARLADRLGAAVATAVNLFNPDVVVIGGGVAEAGEPLFVQVRDAVNRYALESHRRRLRIVPALLGERAGVVGAGLAAWQAFGSENPT